MTARPIERRRDVGIAGQEGLAPVVDRMADLGRDRLGEALVAIGNDQHFGAGLGGVPQGKPWPKLTDSTPARRSASFILATSPAIGSVVVG